MFTSFHVQAFITSGTELDALPVWMYVCLSLLCGVRQQVRRLLRSLQLCNVDFFIYVSKASEVSCVESTDACSVNTCRLRWYFVDLLKNKTHSKMYSVSWDINIQIQDLSFSVAVIYFGEVIKQCNCKLPKCWACRLGEELTLHCLCASHLLILSKLTICFANRIFRNLEVSIIQTVLRHRFVDK